MTKEEKVMDALTLATAPGMTKEEIERKKAERVMRKAKRDYELHVGLLMRTKDVSKAAAQFMAYTEGPEGLKLRLPDAD